jgi:hypothetical protein
MSRRIRAGAAMRFIPAIIATAARALDATLCSENINNAAIRKQLGMNIA